MHDAQAGDRTEKPKLTVSGQFYRSRDDWIRYVIDRPKDQFTIADKAIGVKIAMTTSPKKKPYTISQARIAKDLGVAEQTVKNAVVKFRKAGLLEIEKRLIGTNTKAFNFYRIVPVELAQPKE